MLNMVLGFFVLTIVFFLLVHLFIDDYRQDKRLELMLEKHNRHMDSIIEKNNPKNKE